MPRPATQDAHNARLEKAIALNPDSLDAHVALGRLYEGRKNRGTAGFEQIDAQMDGSVFGHFLGAGLEHGRGIDQPGLVDDVAGVSSGAGDGREDHGIGAVRAAPTVPDSSVRGPMFWPSLMPLITRSGMVSRASSSPFSPFSAVRTI